MSASKRVLPFLLFVLSLAVFPFAVVSGESNNVPEEMPADSVAQALIDEIEKVGDYYTWTFEQKADFYNQYVYHNTGTRKGVPSDDVLSKEAVIAIAEKHLVVEQSILPEEIDGYAVDVEYWIEAYPNEDAEHEYYDIRFLASVSEHEFLSKYQVIISPYSGNVIAFYDLKDLE